MSVTDESRANGAAAVLLEERKPWNQVIATIAVFVAVAVIIALFYKQSYPGLVHRDAMDVAQVARNIAEGKGYSTRFIRPFNAGLLRGDDPLGAAVPELDNAPFYPYAEAMMFRLKGPNDQVAMWTSLIFMLLTVVAIYLLGRLMFGWEAGLLAAAVFGINSAILSTAVAAQGWTAAAFLFTLLLCAIAAHHRACMAGRFVPGLLYASCSAIVTALLYTANVLFIVLLIPVALCFALTTVSKRSHLVTYLILTVLLVTPMMVRNTRYTHSPVLGVAAWHIMADTTAFPADTFYRSTDEGNRAVARAILFPAERFSAFAEKLMRRSGDFLQAVAPMLGLIVLPFAVVSVLYRFRSPAANAIRGFMYVAAPLLMLTFAVYSVDTNAVIVLAPAAAVLASGYFLLLLNAKKLHPVFSRALVGGFVLLALAPTLPTVVWKSTDPRPQGTAAANTLCAMMSGSSGLIYTDAPWMWAWRTNGVGVWVPTSDEDVWALAYQGLEMNVVLLTDESDGLQGEIWYALHRIPAWRDYVKDREKGTDAMVKGMTAYYREHSPAYNLKDIEAYSRRLITNAQRQFRVQKSISGFVEQRSDPSFPDFVQVLMDEDTAPQDR